MSLATIPQHAKRRRICIQLCNVLMVEYCCRAHLSVKLKMGSNLTPHQDHSHPADILLPNWALGKTAAFNISVILPLNPKIVIVLVAGFSAWAATLSIEECNALGWCCIPLVTESYGAWEKEAMEQQNTSLPSNKVLNST